MAEVAQEMGILTIGVVTKPFDFERSQKMNQAMKGIDEIRKHVDALVIIPNQKLLQLNEKALTVPQAFLMVDDVLHRSVKIVSDMINTTALINVDFSLKKKDGLLDAGTVVAREQLTLQGYQFPSLVE